MAKIKAEYGAMISAADRLRNSAKNVSSMYDEVTRILKNMPLSTNYYRGVQSKMLLQSESIQQTGQKLETAAGAVEQIVSMYKAADLAAANGTAVAYAKANANILGGIAGLFDDKSWLEKVTGVISNKLSNPHLEHLALLGGLGMAGAPGLTVYGLYRLIEANSTYENVEFKPHLLKGDLSSFLDDVNDKFDDKMKENGLLKKESSKGLSRDFAIASIEGEKTVSLLHAEGEYTNGRFSTKGSVDVLTAGYTAEAGLGKFTYKDKDGKEIGAIGLYGELGGSVAAAKAEGEVRYGTDVFGVYAKGDAKVLSASAKAESVFAWSDRGLQAKVGAGAEANLAEVSGSAGFRVAGTDIGVKGSAKIGVGAKADIGIKDGVLSVDVGASLGIGLEVGFDIDMSDTIDFVKENADNFKSWANDAHKAAVDTWNATTTAASDFVSDVGEGVKDAGKAVGKGIKDVGKAIDKFGDKFSKLFGG